MERALSMSRRVVSPVRVGSAETPASNTSTSPLTGLVKTAINTTSGTGEQQQVGGNNYVVLEREEEGDEIEKMTIKGMGVCDDARSQPTSSPKVKSCSVDGKQALDFVEKGYSQRNIFSSHQLNKSKQTKELPVELTERIKDKFNQTAKLEASKIAKEQRQDKSLTTINSSCKFIEQQQRQQQLATGVKKKSNSLLDALIEGRKSWFEERTIIVDIRNNFNNNTSNNKKGSQQNHFNDRSDLIKNKVSCREKSKIIKHLEEDEEQFDSLNQVVTLKSNYNDKKKTLFSSEDKTKSKNSTKLASKSSNQISNKTLSANSNQTSYINKETGNNISEQVSGKLKSVEEEKQRQDEKTNRELKREESNNKEPTTDNNLDNKQVDIIKSKGKKAEDRQQVAGLATQASKGKTPPTFGGTPYKVSRLPYYSYYGRARNVDLITAADRGERLNRGKNNQIIAAAGRYIDGSGQSSDSSNSFDSSSVEIKSQENQSGSSSSPSANQSEVGKVVPTLSRTSGYRDSRQINDLIEGEDYNAIKRPSSRQNTNLYDDNNIDENTNSRSKRRIFKNGFSNISNLFPEQQMNNYYGSNKVAAEQQTRERNRQLRFNSEERLASRARQQQQQSWNSLSNLNQASRGKSSGSSRFAPSSVLSRRNSITSNYTSNQYTSTRPNRSMNSLNTSPYSNISDNQLQQRQQLMTMRRQNSSSGYGSKQRGASYQGRSMSASSAYARGHHRSPSASSLHYGSAGMSPYSGGPPPIDPDCPVHGYSPVNQVHSKSSQHLAGGSDADLLYEPYNVGYYDRGAPPMATGGSLYSPTSPPLIDRPQTAAIGYGATAAVKGGAPVATQGGRLLTAAANGNPNAYYNNTSRFSMYHSPINGFDNVRSTLAPPNEQLRRILGYPPHTRPIYLHPQWAYSRPFIHLQGTTRSPSPGSPLDGDDDIIGGGASGDIRPRFEPYNQLHDTQAIRAVDFHPSGEVYAVGSNSRALRICAYPADYELRHFSHHDHVTTAPRILFKFLQVHRGSIYCVSFNSTGQLLATGSNDQTVHIVRYNSITHSPDGDEYRLTMHDGTVRDLCFIDDSSSGSLLLSAGGGDNKIYVTDCDTITPFQSMAGHTQMIMALHHWGGSNFVSASYDRTIRFWDLRTRACTSIISAPPTAFTSAGNASGGGGTSSGKSWGGPGAPVCAVKVDPTGRLLASGHNDSTCMLYDIRGARIIQAFKPHDDEIRTVSFSPKSYYLLTGGYDGRIVLTDIQGDLTQPLPSVCVAENDDKIVQSKWHPSDFTFVTTSADKTATLWAMPTE